jgi:hypothetical protein
MVFHGTTYFTTQGKKCGGRPLLSAVPERFHAETAVRCLCCKTDLADPEQLRLHLAVPGCTGPIYAKNAVLPPPAQVFRGRYYFIILPMAVIPNLLCLVQRCNYSCPF